MVSSTTMSDYPTLSKIRLILEDRNLAPRKKMGQNFLIEANIARKSLELAELKPGDTVVEVGPGLGALTRLMLDLGCTVYAVELDRGLHAYLKEHLCPEYPDTFHLIEGDALDHPIAECPITENGQFKIVANLPYAISTPWMESVLAGALPSHMVLMLQKEAADRFVGNAGTGNFGPISIFLTSAYDNGGIHKVGAQCFYPRPEVGSALLNLQLKPKPFLFDPEARQFIRSLFQQRRKQIGSLLRQCDTPPLAIQWMKRMDELEIPTTLRPEAITVEQWQAIIGS